MTLNKIFFTLFLAFIITLGIIEGCSNTPTNPISNKDKFADSLMASKDSLYSFSDTLPSANFSWRDSVDFDSLRISYSAFCDDSTCLPDTGAYIQFEVDKVINILQDDSIFEASYHCYHINGNYEFNIKNPFHGKIFLLVCFTTGFEHLPANYPHKRLSVYNLKIYKTN